MTGLFFLPYIITSHFFLYMYMYAVGIKGLREAGWIGSTHFENFGTIY